VPLSLLVAIDQMKWAFDAEPVKKKPHIAIVSNAVIFCRV